MAIYEKQQDDRINSYLKKMLSSLSGLQLNEEGLLILENTTKAITHALEQIALLENELIRQNTTTQKPTQLSKSALDDASNGSNAHHIKKEPTSLTEKRESNELIPDLPTIKKFKTDEASRPVIPNIPAPQSILVCVDLTDDLEEPHTKSPLLNNCIQPYNSQLKPQESPQRNDSIYVETKKSSASETPTTSNLNSTEEKDLPGKQNPSDRRENGKNDLLVFRRNPTATESDVPPVQLLLNVGYTAFMTTRCCGLSQSELTDVLNQNGISGITDVKIVNNKSRSYAFVIFDTPDNFKYALERGGTILVHDFPLFIYPNKQSMVAARDQSDKNAPLFPWKKKQKKVVFQGTYKRFTD